MPDRLLRLKQALAAPEIKNGTAEDDKEFAPDFPRPRAVRVRYFGIDKEEVPGPARHRGQVARFHPPASLQEINQRVTAEGPRPREGDAATMADIPGEGNLADFAGDVALQRQPGAPDGIVHAKTYMFFTIASISEKRLSWYPC
jgi:hypothetical protein